jgi:hypothetical protein
LAAGRLLRPVALAYSKYLARLSGTRERAALGGLVARSHTVESFERTPMALSFPNKSRAFDATRRAVRFWGYDSAMEVAFFITEDALKRVQPDMRSDEAGLLRAFDSNWDLICRRAAKIYARGRKGSYDLVGADF